MRNLKTSLVIISALFLVLAGSIGTNAYSMTQEEAIAGMTADSTSIRRHAAYYLGEEGNPAHVDLLVSSLSDSDAHVRRIAAHALGKLQNSNAVFPLIGLLSDRNQPTGVRCSAALALARIGNPRAIKILAQTVQEENGWLKNIACSCLTRLQPTTTLAMAN